ncbi:hypothetical protein H8356DRAFT_1267919 [Neocallimastix lanati (nom. inval.)]|uniref:Uncharacterized protein n=1 Tax=Neocallimastix californiae TaxID=1754190 RepID=A0A1Y2FV25_9FUNG|nr:hypothetical protein H8356DRAFT_1267919 [Neocallimastix sp. JGI-2020a]ORY86545.1 hypothetical protein LY90DRAFT_99757 [Neocallimastix californiae]|eukprot:ORY86545.1 hypothetical protein LY90DRAFT_99757 [Neocallimastix californiae]
MIFPSLVYYYLYKNDLEEGYNYNPFLFYFFVGKKYVVTLKNYFFYMKRISINLYF